MVVEKKGIVVCVCGGRDFTDQRAVSRALNRLHALNTVVEVVHGGAPGADACAGNWAASRRIFCIAYAADWASNGRAAQRMRILVIPAEVVS